MRSDVRDYEIVAPRNLRAALELMAESPGAWTPIAGGTDLMVQLAAGRLASPLLMSIWKIPELRAISSSPAEIRIGAVSTYTNLRRNLIICHEFPSLASAASWTGGVANQNRGTLGGNIVNASPAADSPPALLVYDAELELTSVRGARRVPYSTFHVGYKETLLAPDELVTAVILPRRPRPGMHYLRKVGARRAQAISKIGLAGYGEIQNGRVTEVRVALASAAPTPVRCFRTEKCLSGAALSDEAVKKASEALSRELQPIDDIRSTETYRRQVAINLLREFLAKLVAHPSVDRE